MKKLINDDRHYGLSITQLTILYYYRFFDRGYVIISRAMDDIFNEFINTEQKGARFVSGFKTLTADCPDFWERSDSDYRHTERSLTELDDIGTSSFTWHSFYNGLPAKLKRRTAQFLCTFMKDILEDMIKVSEHERSASIRRESELQSVFGLNPEEMSLLKYILAIEADDYEFQRAKNSFGQNGTTQLKLASIATGLSQKRVSFYLGSRSRLITSGIVNYSFSQRNSFDFDIDDSILDFVSGLQKKDSLMKSFVRIDRDKPLLLKSFVIEPENTALSLRLLETSGPTNILFHGVAGTGKTEYARSLARAAGKRAIFVATRKQSSGRDGRQVALEASLNIVSDNDVLIVDEADYLMNTTGFFRTPDQDKGWLNDLLDRSEAKIIWISNYTGNVEESHLRRFSFSLFFDKFGSAERQKIWHNIVAKSALSRHLDSNTIEYYSNEYEVNAGGIASACSAASRIIAEGETDTQKIKDTTARILEQHERLITGLPHKKSRLFNIACEYNLNFVNSSIRADVLLAPLTKIAKLIKEKATEEYNANLLLYGIPGTGKTEFVKYLAAHIKMKILLKRASDLMHPYVGVTEMLIREAFKEAQKDGKILFIDEADTFFSERSGASASWQTSQTNEFLSQMENFRGILVCATNMKLLLDSAALRRFNFKVEFKPLRQKDYLPVYIKYFGTLTGTPDNDNLQRLLSIEELTFGDFRAVANAYKFSDRKDVPADEVISRIIDETRHRTEKEGNKVGF